MQLEDLEVMRQEFGISERHALPFNVNDDLKQIQMCTSRGVSLEDWRKARGVPLDYAAALQRYLEQ